MEKTINFFASAKKAGDAFTMQVSGTVTYETSHYPTQKAIKEEIRKHAFKQFGGRYPESEIKVKIS